MADKGFIAVQPDGTKALVQVDEDPAVFGPLTRMGTPIGVEVLLADVDPARMAALVEASWRHRAPPPPAQRLTTNRRRSIPRAGVVVVAGSAFAAVDRIFIST